MCISQKMPFFMHTHLRALHFYRIISQGGGGQAHLRTRPLLGRWKMCPSRGLPFKGSRCRRLRGGGAGVEGWKEGLRHYSRGRKVLQPLVLGGRTQRSCDRRGNSRWIIVNNKIIYLSHTFLGPLKLGRLNNRSFSGLLINIKRV